MHEGESRVACFKIPDVTIREMRIRKISELILETTGMNSDKKRKKHCDKIENIGIK